MSEYTDIRDVGPSYLAGAGVGVAAGTVSGYDPLTLAFLCSAATGELGILKNLYLESGEEMENEDYNSLLDKED